MFLVFSHQKKSESSRIEGNSQNCNVLGFLSIIGYNLYLSTNENSCSFRKLFRRPNLYSEWHLTLFLSVRNKLWFRLFQIPLFEIETEFRVIFKTIPEIRIWFSSTNIEALSEPWPRSKFQNFGFFSLLRIFVATK